MFEIGFVLFYGGATTISSLAWLAGRIPAVRHYGLMAVANGMCVLVAVFYAWTSTSLIAAVATAIFGWLWWRNGGGDSTRRRFRTWAAGFQGVRRTAPSHA
ncbi:hypothetical protein [Streptomyces sp. AD55]|uniref:hypothetical protein n=1 Tax=Streptomyces sp. AD55 TaxID=3242895 RepID=UPI003528CB97